jgi:aminoglycoside 3-N-acetyltransferase
MGALSTLKAFIPSHLHARLRPAFRAAKRRIARIDQFVDRRAFTRDQFVAHLGDLGFTSGATVMLHSSFRAIRRRAPFLSAPDLIHLFQDILGEEGTLLMPTFPVSGRQADYVAGHRRFSLRETPSMTGALTEVFRTTPGVVRSIHPTHPVAAWGRRARDLVATHHEGSTFGAASPFCRLRESNGIVVGLGTRLRNAFTILHVAEDLNPDSRELAFEAHPRQLIVDDGSGERLFELRVMRTDVSREYGRVERILLDEGVLRYTRVHGLQCAKTNAAEFIDRTLRLAEANAYLLRKT